MLPEHHLPRPRLLARHQLAPVLVVLGASGAGKSVLAAELARRLERPLAIASVGPQDGHLEALIARMHEALVAAGLDEAATTLVARDTHPCDMLAALSEHLRGSPDRVLLVVDHAHHLDDEAVDALTGFAASIPPGQHLVVLSRRREGAAARLGLLTSQTVSERALAFTRDEVTAYVNSLLRLDLPPRGVDAILHATNGRALDLVLAARHVGRIDDLDLRHRELARLAARPRVVTTVTNHLLARTSRAGRRALAQMAALPWVDETLAARITRRPTILARAVDAGLARTDESGRTRFEDDVRDALRSHGTASRRTLRHAAARQLEVGDLRSAVRTLLAAGYENRAAKLLLAHPERCMALHTHDHADLVAALPDETVTAHPELLLTLVRHWHAVGRPDRVRVVLRVVHEQGDEVRPALRHAFEAERLRDAVHGPVHDLDAVEARMRELVALTRPRHPDVTARLHEGLGLLEARRGADGWQERARQQLDTAIELYERGGEHWLAGLASTLLATTVCTRSGSHDAAADHLDRAVALARGEPRLTSLALVHRSRVHARRGQHVLARADLTEGARIARLLDDHDALALVDDTATLLRRLASDARASAGADDGPHIEVRALGRFAVLVDGREAPLRQGVASRLVRLLAVRGGRLHELAVAEVLWPTDDPHEVRGRLDSVRHRLGPAPQIVTRDDDTIGFVAGTRLDVSEFVSLAREALSTRREDGTIDVIAARTAVEHYAELLPDHDEDWVVEHRLRLRRRVLDVIDGLIETALHAGDEQEASRWARRALEVAEPGTGQHARLTDLAEPGPELAALRAR